MAISYVGGKGAGQTGATGSTSVTLTSGWSGGSGGNPLENDVVVITISAGTQARQPTLTITNPAGYTALTVQRTTATTYDTNVQTFYKRMGSTPDTSVTIPRSGNTADGSAYVIHVFRGVDTTTVEDVTPTYATGSGTNNRPDPASITPSTDGAWIYFGGGGAASNGTTVFTISYCSGVLSYNGADTNDGTVGAGYYTGWTSGAYDGAAFGGGSVNANNSWGCTALVLRPGPNDYTHQGAVYGTETWQSGRITQKANQGFLESSPATRYGNTTRSWSPTGPFIMGQRFLCPGTGTVTIEEIGAWVDADSSTTGTFRFGIFTNDAANHCPEAMVADSETGSLTHNTTTLTKKYATYSTRPSLTGGEYYWLMIYTADGNLNGDMLSGSTPDEAHYVTATTYPTWWTGSQWHSSTVNPDDLGLYAVIGKIDYLHTGAIYSTQTLDAKYGGNVMLAESANIASGGANTTTYQLTAPSGKATTDFTVGRIADDTNPLTVDIAVDDYTELEWSVIVNGSNSEIYDLRVTANGTPLDTYTLTPQYTIGTGGVDFTHQGAVVSTRFAVSGRAVEKIGDVWDFSTQFRTHTRTVDINKIIGVTATKFAAAARTVEKVMPGTVFATETWATELCAALLNYIYQGTLFSTQYHAATRTIEKTGDIWDYSTQYRTHTRTVEKVVPGTVVGTRYQTHLKTIERMLYGTQYVTDTWISGYMAGLKNFVYAGAVFGTDSWITQRLIERIVTGAVYSTDTWISEQKRERAAIIGAILATQTWQSEKKAEALKVGAIYSTQTLAATRTIEKIIDDILAGEFSWVTEFEGNLFHFVHEGLIKSDQTWLYPFIVSKIFHGTVNAAETWSSERYRDSLCQGSIFSADTWRTDRTVERIIEGTVYSVLDWKATIGRQMVFIGNFNGQDYWVSQKSFETIITGAINAEEFWSHIVTKRAWSMPSDIYIVPSRIAVADVPGRISVATAPSRTANASVAPRIGVADYEGS